MNFNGDKCLFFAVNVEVFGNELTLINLACKCKLSKIVLKMLALQLISVKNVFLLHFLIPPIVLDKSIIIQLNFQRFMQL